MIHFCVSGNKHLLGLNPDLSALLEFYESKLSLQDDPFQFIDSLEAGFTKHTADRNGRKILGS